MKYLFTGSRNWRDQLPVGMLISTFDQKEDIIIVGDCPTGLDLIVREYCEAWGPEYNVFYADWDKQGLAAGPFRNARMVSERPNVVFAFHEDIKSSKGTKDCIKRALVAKIPVYLISTPRMKP